MLFKRSLRNRLLLSGCVAVAGVAISSSVLAGTYTVASGTTQTVSTQLTGTDSVLVTGGGTLILSNTSNTYTGGTQVIGGSILQIDSDTELGGGNLALGDGSTLGTVLFGGATTVASSRTLTLNKGNQTFNTGSYVDTIASNIVGTGALVKTGSGTLILTGTNSYSGVTTVSAGTLQIGSGSTTGNIGGATASVASGAYLTFNRSDAVTYSGVISGAGTLTQAGSSTLTLTGANTLSGSTVISSGSTLALSGAGALTSSQINVVGTFDISAITAAATTVKYVASTGNVVLGTKTLTMTSGAAFGGVISGSGGLTITGGTESLTGHNTYTGTTTIGTGATLTIGNNSSATKTGWIDSQSVVVNGTGLLNFYRYDTVTYSGTISGTGNVRQNGSGTLYLTGNNTYTGMTTVAAGTLVLGSTSVTALNLPGGVTTTGTLRIGNGAAATLTTSTYTQTGILNIDVTPNGTSKLVVSGAATLAGSVTISAEAGTYKPAVYTLLTAGSITGSFSSRYSGHSGNAGFAVYAKSANEIDIIVVPRSSAQVYGNLVTSAFDTANSMVDSVYEHAAFGGTRASDKKSADGKWTSWVQAFGGTNHVGGGDGASAFNSHSTGFLGGVGYAVDESMGFNGAVGYTTGGLTVSDKSAKADDVNALFFSGSVHASGPLVSLELGGYYLGTSSDVSRVNSLGGINKTPFHSSVVGLAGQLSHAFFGGDVTPLIKFSVAKQTTGSFAETNGDIYSLNGTHSSQFSTGFDAGVRLSHTFTLSNGVVLQPHLLAGAHYDTALTEHDVTVGFINVSGSSFLGQSAVTDRYSAVTRLGLDAKLDQSWTVEANFNGRFGEKQQLATFSLGAVYRF